MKKQVLAILVFSISLILSVSAQPAQSTLTVKSPKAEFAGPSDPKSGFMVSFTVDLKKFDGAKNILEIPDVLTVSLRRHDPLNRERQNYPAFKMPDGTVPVLEANIVLHSAEHPDWKNITIGIPLAMLRKPDGKHEVVLNFSGVRWTLYVDGELLDNDFPFGYPLWRDRNEWRIDTEYVSKADIYLPSVESFKKRTETSIITSGIQYWTPPGHNSWVGDVATIFYKGRYHVFYLFDRRHHGSKFGCGAHYFEHLSTKDFKTWTVHEAATPLEEQWETIGTGMPFVFNDKFCISYGMHTTRIYPREKTVLSMQWEYLNKNGRTAGFKFNSTSGIPAGATYSVSDDGIANFTKSHIMFHPCENPSVFTAPNGRLSMIANYGSKGLWESDSLNGGWLCINADFPPGGDCTVPFHWGKFDYIIGGFVNLWIKPDNAPIMAYEDVVAKGLDFYDGLGVPIITEISDGRFLMAGWAGMRGWGGCLVIRELIQFPDGRIGSKWLKEIMPETGNPQIIANSISETVTFPANSNSFILEFKVYPAQAMKGRLAITFLPENGEQASCELQIRLEDLRAQFATGSLNGFAEPEKSLREGGGPQSIENLIGVGQPFTVRVIVNGYDKFGGSIVDAEIAGQRTMITFRPDLAVRKMLFRVEGIELQEIQIAPFKR
jgi:hypothetical protein